MKIESKLCILDLALVVALARRFKNSKPRTLMAAAARCAPHMTRETQPIANQLKRREDIGLWVDQMIDHHAYLHHKRLQDEQESSRQG